MCFVHYGLCCMLYMSTMLCVCCFGMCCVVMCVTVFSVLVAMYA